MPKLKGAELVWGEVKSSRASGRRDVTGRPNGLSARDHRRESSGWGQAHSGL